MYNPLHTEQHMLGELALGKQAATERIYRQHYPVISHWIINNGGDESEAGDVFQEAMVILFQKAQHEDFRLSCKIGTYLFAVSKHLWYKKLQQRQRQPGYLPDDAGIDEGRDWAYEDDVKVYEERELHYEQLDAALSQLGEPCSSLLKAFYHQDKSMQQIATEFGYTNPENAKTQKYKCLTRLRKIFYSVQAK
ncbi:RNA polymerase sigma factor [Chitinophagaceae bacterium MMS25-I14]